MRFGLTRFAGLGGTHERRFPTVAHQAVSKQSEVQLRALERKREKRRRQRKNKSAARATSGGDKQDVAQAAARGANRSDGGGSGATRSGKLVDHAEVAQDLWGGNVQKVTVNTHPDFSHPHRS